MKRLARALTGSDEFRARTKSLQRKRRPFAIFRLTESRLPLCCVFREAADPAGAGCSSRVRSEPSYLLAVNRAQKAGVCCCTRVEWLIFDSLVLSPCTTGFVRLRLYGLYGVMKSE